MSGSARPLAPALYPGSKHYATWVLQRTGLGAALSAALTSYSPRFVIPLVGFVLLVLWGLRLRFDRRPYVEVTADGIWCRSWGRARYRFAQFKAAYARQDRTRRGVVLVPRAAAEIVPTLSWRGRYLMRSGGGVPAHAGALTLWTTRIGVDRDAFLRGLVVAIADARPQADGA